MEAVAVGTSPPPFPEEVVGYSLSDTGRQVVRVFEGMEWSTLHELPVTMNGCAHQRFYIRWRAVSPEATVEATSLSFDGIVLGDVVDGAAGWMSDYGCGQPGFRLVPSADGSTLADVVVEVQRWEVSV